MVFSLGQMAGAFVIFCAMLGLTVGIGMLKIRSMRMPPPSDDGRP
jgi:hypothetical protein